MRLFTWFRRGKSCRQPSPEDAAFALVEALVEWCSEASLLKTRKDLHIPEQAHNFENEMFYLYVFLFSLSIEITYAKRPDYGVNVARALMDRIAVAAEEGRFGKLEIASELMKQRYEQYLQLRSRGLEYLIEHLPYAFLVTNGVCPSDKREHMELLGRPRITMEVWVGTMLKHLCDAHRRWQQMYA